MPECPFIKFQYPHPAYLRCPSRPSTSISNQSFADKAWALIFYHALKRYFGTNDQKELLFINFSNIDINSFTENILTI